MAPRWLACGAAAPEPTTGITGEADDEVTSRPEPLGANAAAPAAAADPTTGATGERNGVARVPSTTLATGATEDVDGNVPPLPSITRRVGITEDVRSLPPVSTATGPTDEVNGNVPPLPPAGTTGDCDDNAPPSPPTSPATGITDDCDDTLPPLPPMDRWIGFSAGVDDKMPVVRSAALPVGSAGGGDGNVPLLLSDAVNGVDDVAPMASAAPMIGFAGGCVGASPPLPSITLAIGKTGEGDDEVPLAPLATPASGFATIAWEGGDDSPLVPSVAPATGVTGELAPETSVARATGVGDGGAPAGDDTAAPRPSGRRDTRCTVACTGCSD